MGLELSDDDPKPSPRVRLSFAGPPKLSLEEETRRYETYLAAWRAYYAAHVAYLKHPLKELDLARQIACRKYLVGVRPKHPTIAHTVWARARHQARKEFGLNLKY